MLVDGQLAGGFAQGWVARCWRNSSTTSGQPLSVPFADYLPATLSVTPMAEILISEDAPARSIRWA